MILKRELVKEKNDEMKYSHFLCTLERANQEKLKQAIVQLKCVPCLNKFSTNFYLTNTPSSQTSSSSSTNNMNNSKSIVSHANMNRLLKQMSLIVSTELQQIAIDLYERMDEDKPVKFIRLKDEFKYTSIIQQQSPPPPPQQQQQQLPSPSTSSNPVPTYSSISRSQPSTNTQLTKSKITDNQINSLANNLLKKVEISSSSQAPIGSSKPNSTSGSASTTVGFFSQQQQNSTSNPQNRLLPISNPNKFLNQFKAEEKKLPSSNSSNSIETYNNLYYYRC